MAIEQIQVRRDTAANWASANPVLGSGEPAYETDTGILKVGTGVAAYADLPAYLPLNSSGYLPPSVVAYLDAFNAQKYQTLQNVYVWSYANNLAGPGPGGVVIDSTAAANVARNTSAKASEGYIAIGREALGLATRARACIAIGSKALGAGNPGFGNLAIGAFALTNVQGNSEFAADLVGSRNIGIGSLAGYFVTSGYMNTFVGRDSGQTATTGLRNTAVGYGAFTRGIAPVGIDGTIVNYYPVTGSDNTAVGTQAGGMLAGSNNVAVGSQAAVTLRASDNNVFIGNSASAALGSTTSENGFIINTVGLAGTYTQTGTTITVTATASGVSVGKRVSLTFISGQISTVTGEAQWMLVASVVNANTFTVTSPVSQTDSGNVTVNTVESSTASAITGANVVIGYQAHADAVTTGGNNVYVGEQTARSATGINNTTLGSRSGFNMTTGTQNTFLGYNAGRALSTGGGLTTQSNCTVVGFSGTVSGDNQVQLGNASTTTYVYGTVQNRSDIRDKADVRDTKLGLDFIKALRPVDYRWDMREDYIEYDEDGNTVVHERDGSKKRERYHHGLIAQEVAEVIAESGIDFGGYQDHSKSGGAQVQSLGYDELIAPHIRATQELAQMVADLKAELAALKEKSA
jgi:hypothetical protein